MSYTQATATGQAAEQAAGRRGGGAAGQLCSVEARCAPREGRHVSAPERSAGPWVTPGAGGRWSLPGSAPLSPPPSVSSPPRPPTWPLRCAAQAQTEDGSTAAQPGPGAWRVRRGARGRERGAPGTAPGSAGAGAALPAVVRPPPAPA
jgi:hypothetical protein